MAGLAADDHIIVSHCMVAKFDLTLVCATPGYNFPSNPEHPNAHASIMSYITCWHSHQAL